MVQARSKRFDAARSMAPDRVVGPSALPVLVTWESELRAIAEEAARWDRVDMKQRFIHLTKTKTRKARSIPINDALLEALRHLPRHLGTDYVFWNHETETRFVSIKKAWRTVLKKAKITSFRFHDLRHTFASYVQMGLGDLRATQALLGHADPRMTMRYAHLSDARLREAVRSLNHLQTGATPGAISAGSVKK